MARWFLAGLFADKLNVFRPSHWGMIRDILRFHKDAAQLAVAKPTPRSVIFRRRTALGFASARSHHWGNLVTTVRRAAQPQGFVAL